MNIDENEYVIVFIVNKLLVFKFLGEFYFFYVFFKLLLGYDYCCESQDVFIECVKLKGVIVMNVNLIWFSLKLDKVDVKKKFYFKRKVVKFKGWGFYIGYGGMEGGDFFLNQLMFMDM